MDPLSITTGAITILGTIAATRKAARKLLALRAVPNEILQVTNEVSLDFHCTSNGRR